MKLNSKKIAAAAALVLTSTGTLGAPLAGGGVFSMYSQDGLDQSGVLSGSEIPINVDTTITAFVDQDAGTWGWPPPCRSMD